MVLPTPGIFKPDRNPKAWRSGSDQATAYLIRVNSKHDPNVQFVTLIHELAHLFLGHLGPDKYLIIPIPSENEQAGIVKYIESETEKLEMASKSYTPQITLLAEYRTALIHECLTGQREI